MKQISKLKSELNQKEKTYNNSNNKVNKNTLDKINILLTQLDSYTTELDNRLFSNISNSEKKEIESWRNEIESISDRLKSSRDYLETNLEKQINFKNRNNNRKQINVGA